MEMARWGSDLHELLACPLSIFHGTPITLLMGHLSHLLCGPNLRSSRALDAPSAFPMERSALLFLVPGQIPNSCPGFIPPTSPVEICFANTFSPNGTYPCDAVCRAVFQTVLSRRDISDTSNHGKTGESSRSSSCVFFSLWY